MPRRIAFTQIQKAATLRVINLRRSQLVPEGPAFLAELQREWESDVVQVGVPYRGKSWAALASHNDDQPMFRYADGDWSPTGFGFMSIGRTDK